MGTFSRKGLTLSLGLVSETVRLTGAIDNSTKQDLKSICVGAEKQEHPATAIKSQYVCETCGPIINRDTLLKGRPSGDGWAVVAPEEVKQLRDATGAEFKKTVALTAHPADQVLTSTVATGSLYYLEPDSSGDRFAIIRDLIADNPQYAFVAQYTVSSRVAMYVAHVKGDAIMLEQRQAMTNVKQPPQIEAEANQAMLQMAEQLLGQMVNDFDPISYADTYTSQLAEMLSNADVVEGAPTAEGDTKTHKKSSDDDLMAALAAELAQAKPKKKASTTRRRKAS